MVCVGPPVSRTDISCIGPKEALQWVAKTALRRHGVYGRDREHRIKNMIK